MDGIVFTPKTTNHHYCSRRCLQRITSAKARGTEPLTGPIGESYTCAWCGTRCIPGENVVAHAKRFCPGEECKKRWHARETSGRAYLPIPVARDRQAIAQWREHCAIHSIEQAFGKHLKRDDLTYRRALRKDPCAYCGEPGEALDHIEPKSAAGIDDWTNRTSSCRRCNSTKGTVSLLLALPWIPASKQYHDMRRILFAAA